MLCVLSDLPEIGGQIAGLLFPPPGRSSRKPSRLIECVMAVVMETDHAYTCAIINGLNLCHILLKTHVRMTYGIVHYMCVYNVRMTIYGIVHYMCVCV